MQSIAFHTLRSTTEIGTRVANTRRGRLFISVLIFVGAMTPARWIRAEDATEREASAGAPASASAFYANKFGRPPSVDELTETGRALFFDKSLSASGEMSCGSCHDPRFAFGPPNALPVQRGGRELKSSGIRAVPSLRYMQTVPSFTEHFEDEEQGGADQGPAGGRTWDGRTDTAHDQARLPLLSSFEMANTSPEAIVRNLERGASARRFRETFGADIFTDSARAFEALLLSLEVFQQNPADFYPYSSRYDAWLRGRGKLTPQEQRGLALFNDPKKGNCAVCHPSQMRGGALPQFSDFGFVALGVPRNRRIPANANAGYYDLGLCGPERQDLKDRDEYCGMFRTPSLRNVAIRRTFFHNGAFDDLRRVLQFYVDRDLHPQRWYATDRMRSNLVYDDLPARYHGNVNREPPFDRKPGDRPALSKSEIEDVIAFLQTLTDADLIASNSEQTKQHPPRR